MRLEILDAGGRLACSRVDETGSAGGRLPSWDLTAGDCALSPGAYVIRLTTATREVARKIIVLQ